MRLINVETSKIEEFLDYQTPPYAILSHTWGSDLEELTFGDVEEGKIDKPGVGSVKFRGCCREARNEGLKYVWIDTCCINKTNLVELSEAINSMFRYYRRASICYAYLSDVPSDQNPRNDGSKFRTSRWFRRGWTLQELLAPERLVFYSSDWRPLGTKVRLCAVIERITGIHRLFLKGIRDLQSASVAQRMSWAAQRDTKREEDLAYCLLGIFAIAMPMIYGEGGDRAFFRLQEEIMKTTRDHSILAWGLSGKESSIDDSAQSRARGILAAAASDFANSGHIIPRDQSATYFDPLEISGGSLRVSLSLLTAPNETIGLLDCGPEGDTQQVVGIPLLKVASGGSDEYIRPKGCHAVLRPITASNTSPKRLYIRNDNGPNSQASDRGCWVYDDDDFADIHLKLVDVAPQSSWDKDRAIIMSTVKSDGGAAYPTLVRLRHDEQGSRDFILVLEFKHQDARIEAHHCVVICSRDTSLVELAGKLQYVIPKASGKEKATNGLLNLQLALEPIAGRAMFTIRPERAIGPPVVTIDATVELQKPHLTLEIEGILHTQKRWDELQHIDYDDESYEIKAIYGQSPLQWASESGLAEMVHLLLDNGIDEASANKGKRTLPLIAALDRGHAGVVPRLLAASEPPLSAAAPGQPSPRFKPFKNSTTLNQDESGASSFSPFPKVKGTNIPPSDEEKEELLCNARPHVLRSNDVPTQLSWARDVLAWVEVAIEVRVRENRGQTVRSQTPRTEDNLCVDAINIVEFLSSQGHPEALFMRSKWFEFGKFGFGVDKKEAYLGYKRAAKGGWGRAEYRMGMLFENSNEMEEAIKHYNEGMAMKDSAATYRLSMLNILGDHGFKKDYESGLKLLRIAADSCDEDAPQGSYVYGMIIAQELPILNIPKDMLPYNESVARQYIEKAANLGFAKALLRLGQAYELCQLSCDFNPSISLHYYQLSARMGQPEAALGVSRWFLVGYEGAFRKNEQLAFKYVQQAADANLAKGQCSVGFYYEIGIHVQKNLNKAIAWYEKAAANGDQDAKDRLASLRRGKALKEEPRDCDPHD